jgi:predicted phosphatase
MTKWRAFKVLMVCRATNIARYSVIKDEAYKGALLKYLIERLGVKKE